MNRTRLLAVALVATFLAGCATSEPQAPPAPPADLPDPAPAAEEEEAPVALPEPEPPAAEPAAPALPDGWQRYESEEMAFSLLHPREWRAFPTAGRIFFTSPADAWEDDFSENINIVTQDLSTLPDPSLERFYAASMRGLEDAIDDYEVVAERETTIGGFPARQLEFTGTMQDLRVEWIAITGFDPVDERGILVIYTGMPGSAQRATAEEIMRTVEFA